MAQRNIAAVDQSPAAVSPPAHALKEDIVAVTNVESLAPVLDFDSHNCVLVSNVRSVALLFIRIPLDLQLPFAWFGAHNVRARLTIAATGKRHGPIYWANAGCPGATTGDISLIHGMCAIFEAPAISTHKKPLLWAQTPRFSIDKKL